jgi:hypothetical protein
MIWIIKVVKIGLSSLNFGLLFFCCFVPRDDYRLSGVALSKEMRLSMARILERTRLP